MVVDDAESVTNGGAQNWCWSVDGRNRCGGQQRSRAHREWSGQGQWQRSGHGQRCRRGSNHWHWGGGNGDGLVDEDTGSVPRLGARLVGLDVGAVTVGVGHVVHDAHLSVGATETIAAHTVPVGVALLVAEGAACGAGLVVAERVLAEVVLAPVLAA